MTIELPATADTGTKGQQVAVQATKLESVLWSMVLSAMSKTGFSKGALGIGGGVFQNLAMEDIAQQTAGTLGGGLVHKMVEQMTSGTAGASTNSILAARAMATATMPAVLGSTAVAPTRTVDSTPAVAAGGGGNLEQAITFAKSIWPDVQAAAEALGVPPIAVLSQSALETGWGRFVPADNLFGVKAVSGQASTTSPTTEFVNGVSETTNAAFAAYNSVSQGIENYIHLIKTDYSQAVGSSSVAQFANSLAAGGYATDPLYAQKFMSIASSPLMSEVMSALSGSP